MSRAFSSVGRASPLQGEGQKFESSNAHHLRQVELTKQAPSGAFLVCSSPVGHAQIMFCLNSAKPIFAIH